MFETIDDYYSLKPESRKMLVRWFQFSSNVVAQLRSEDYDDDQIIKMMRSIITKKNLKHLEATTECQKINY